MKRSNEPKNARWMTYGVVLGVVGSDVAEPKPRRHLESSWIVPICHARPSESFMCRSIFGP